MGGGLQKQSVLSIFFSPYHCLTATLATAWTMPALVMAAVCVWSSPTSKKTPDKGAFSFFAAPQIWRMRVGHIRPGNGRPCGGAVRRGDLLELPLILVSLVSDNQ